MSVEGKVLTAANVEELAASLGTLSSEDLKRLRTLFCPTLRAANPADLGVRDILQTWIENEPNPTEEKFLKLRTRFDEGHGQASLVSRFVNTLSGSLKYLGRGKASELIEACGSGDRKTVSLLLSKDVKPNQIHRHKTPLLAASLMGHVDIVKDLLKAKANVQLTTTGKRAQPPLNAASSRGHLKVVELLLDNGASVNAIDGEEQTALHEAVFNGHPEVARLLIQRGADVNKQSDDGSTPLHVASAGGNVESVKLLLRSRAKTSIRIPKWDRTALHSASSRGHTEVVELLLQSDNINDQDKNGVTPLMFAAINGHFKTVAFLVNAGADPNIQNKSGKTALIWAVVNPTHVERERMEAVTGALLETDNCNVDIQENEKGWSAIFFAVEKGDVQISKLLLQSGANLDLVGKDKRSVLSVAQTYSPTTYEVLLKAKAVRSKKVPSYYTYDEKYPGMRFFRNPWKFTVTSEGYHVNWGEEIGIEFNIPPGAVPQGKELELSVWPCTAGPFELPEGYELASPVYLITPSFNFLCDITVTMCHFCAVETERESENMVILSSSAIPCTGKHQQPYYQFKILGKGTFKPSESCGHIKLKHFCNTAIGVRRKRRAPSSEGPSVKKSKGDTEEPPKNRYAYKVYRKKQSEDVVIFSAFLNQPCYSEVLQSSVREHFPGLDLRPTYRELIDICANALGLHWPTENGWEISPDRKPCEIPREILDSPEPDTYPPMIKLEVKQAVGCGAPSSNIDVDVVGVSEKKQFVLHPKPQGFPFQQLSPQHDNTGPQSHVQMPYYTVVYGTSSPSGPHLQLPALTPSYPPATGPTIPPMTNLSLKEVQCNLKNLLANVQTTNWYWLGLELNISEYDLDCIKVDHRGDTQTALMETLKLCLRQDPDLSWPKVAKALRNIKEYQNAKQIEDRFCI